MSATLFLSIIVPAYNEVKSIGRTLDAMQAYLDQQPYSYEIIVAADGDDGTRELVGARAADDPRLIVIGSAERGGKGRGIRAGVQIARGQLVGFCDADYKTRIEELAKILPWFEQGYDVVFGSRALAESHIARKQPLYRQIGSWAFGLVMRPLIGLQEIGDTQCGFKFFRQPIARDLFRHQRVDGYMFDVEVLRLAKYRKYTMREVAVDWQDDGDSRSNLLTGSWRIVADLLKIRFTAKPPLSTERASDSPEFVR